MYQIKLKKSDNSISLKMVTRQVKLYQTGRRGVRGEIGPVGPGAETPEATFEISGKVKQTVYNVFDYGVIGDGVTDDGPAILALMEEAGPTGGVVLFPRGYTYGTSVPLVYDSRTVPGSPATGVITSNNTNVSDGDTITVRGLIYTFKTTLSEAYATGSITSNNTNVSNGDTVVVGFKTYTFKTSLSASPTVGYEVLIGASADASLTNLAAAINGSSGKGTTYSQKTKANHMASSSASPTAHVLSLTARVASGSSADLCSLSETAATLSVSGASLTGGVSSVTRQVKIGASADISLGNLAAAINGSTGSGTKYSIATSANASVYAGAVSAHALTLTAYAIGEDGNVYSLAKSATTLTVSGTTLSGGIDDEGVNSLAPSLIGVPGKGGLSSSQGTVAAVKIKALSNFPIGEFIADYIAASLVDVSNCGYQVSGIVFDCNNRAAGVRSFNSNNSNWRDFIINEATVIPNPALKVGNPQGACNAVAYPSVSGYLNHYDNVYVAGAVGQDGFYSAEGNGSYVRLTNCVTSLCGRYGFNTDSATVLVNCNTHGSEVAEYYPAGSLLIGCKMVASTNGNAIRIPDFTGSLTKIVGGEFIGCGKEGKNEKDSALVSVGLGAAYPQISGVTLRTGIATSAWAVADVSTSSFIALSDCTFYIPSDGLHALGTQPFNDHQGTTSHKYFVVSNSQGINPNGYSKNTATTTYTISRSDGIYQRVFCFNDVTLAIENGVPGDMLMLSIDPNGHSVTLPSNITLEYGAASFASVTWLFLVWDVQTSSWIEVSRAPFASYTNDPELSAIAGLTSVADRLPYFTGSGTASLATFTSAGRALVDDTDATAQRTTLGLGTVAVLASDTDGTLAANSDSRIPTQKAVKTYVDAAVTGLLDFKGSTDTSSNPNYPAASKGDAYVVSVAGKIGGASGKSVDVGDVYLATTDNAGGTEAAVGTSWTVLEHNLAGALLSANNLSDLASAATARTNLGLGNVDNTSDATKNAAAVSLTNKNIDDSTNIVPQGSNVIDQLRKRPVLSCDFLSSGSSQVDPFKTSAFGTGASVSGGALAASTQHPGIIRIVSGTAANSGGYIGTDTNPFLLGGGEVFESVFYLSSVTNGTFWAGFIDNGTAAEPTDGVYIGIDSSGVVTGKTSSNTTRSSTGTTYAASVGGWYRLRITINSTSLVTFQLYNDAGTLLWSDTLTTNIPTAGGRDTGAGILAYNSGVSSFSMIHVDFLAVTWSTNRTR